MFDVPSSPQSGRTCGGFICEPAQRLSTTYELVDPANCDPTVTTCSVRYRVDFAFPGNTENIDDAGSIFLAPTPKIYYFDEAEAPECSQTDSDQCGAYSICGLP